MSPGNNGYARLDSDKAIKLNPGNWKAHYRRALVRTCVLRRGMFWLRTYLMTLHGYRLI